MLDRIAPSQGTASCVRRCGRRCGSPRRHASDHADHGPARADAVRLGVVSPLRLVGHRGPVCMRGWRPRLCVGEFEHAGPCVWARADRLVTTVLIHLPILTWDIRVPASLFLPLQFGTLLALMAFEGLLKLVDRCVARARGACRVFHRRSPSVDAKVVRVPRRPQAQHHGATPAQRARQVQRRAAAAGAAAEAASSPRLRTSATCCIVFAHCNGNPDMLCSALYNRCACSRMARRVRPRAVRACASLRLAIWASARAGAAITRAPAAVDRRTTWSLSLCCGRRCCP
jgi:hypothetical protein